MTEQVSQAEEDLTWVNLSLLQHYAYCPHQARLIDEGVWLDNHLTVQGNLGHARVDQTGRDCRRGVTVHHRVPLASHTLRIQGIADAIEQDRDAHLTPVEYKHGRGAGNLFPSIVQVSAQALCLEEMTGTAIPIAWIYLLTEKRRERVEVSGYRQEVARIADQIRVQRTQPGETPAYTPALCRACSVRTACQPRGGPWV